MVKVSVNQELLRSMIHDMVFVLVVLGLLFIMEQVYADGIDHDKSFYGKDVIVEPDDIDVWHNYNGIWVKDLPRKRFWRNFEQLTCYYPINCIDSGDKKKKWHNDDDDDNDGIQKAPEPEIIGLLGFGLLVMGVRSKIRGSCE